MAWSKARGVVEAELLRHTRGLGNRHIDVDVLADAMGIDVVGLSWPDNPIEGKYVRRNGRSFILVNTSRPFTRQRFTIAHEVGHYRLTGGEDDVEFVDDASSMYSQTNEERQANLFASALLMDEHGVREVTDGVNPRGAIAKVVQIFEVSLEAAAIRLSELQIVDGQTVKAFLDEVKDRGRRSEFMGMHGLGIREDRWRYQTRIPAHFSRRARRLHEAGILSDERAHEILDRPRPPVEA